MTAAKRAQGKSIRIEAKMSAPKGAGDDVRAATAKMMTAFEALKAATTFGSKRSRSAEALTRCSTPS